MNRQQFFISLAKPLLGIFITLLASLAITACVAIYYPPAFKWTFKIFVEMVSDHQPVSVKTYDNLHFRDVFNIPTEVIGDDAIFSWLEEALPHVRRDDSLIYRALMVHNKGTCKYTHIGKHRTMAIFWIVQGEECYKKRIKKDSFDKGE